MGLYEKFLEIKLEERDNYIKELKEQGKTAQDIKDMFLQDKPTDKEENTYYNAVKKRLYPHIRNVFGKESKKASTTVKKVKKQVSTECTQNIPQDIPQENNLYLELLERVERLEKNLIKEPTKVQEQFSESEYINTGIRVDKAIWKAFNEFCNISKERKQIAISKALYEYMQNNK